MHVPSEIIVAIIAGALGSTGLWQLVQFLLNKNSAEKEMILGLGYDRLIHVCRSYLKRGWVATEELEDTIKYLYLPYKRMGGNGTAEMMIEKVKRLPNSDPNAKENEHEET